MRVYAIAAWLVLLPAPLCAQIQSAPPPSTPAPPSLIDELVANAAHYRDTLPSVTADESIVSEGAYMGIFRKRTLAQGTFRVIRTPEGTLKESRQIAVLDGKSVDPSKKADLPIVLFGGFGQFQQVFFSPQQRPCFVFSLLPQPGPGGTQQIAVSPAPDSAEQAACKLSQSGIAGLVRVDAATRQIVHFERTVSDAFAAKTHLAPFVSVDSAPARVGDNTFWLPTQVIGRILNGRVHGTFTANYSNYHRYAGSMTLLPGATEIDSTPDHEPAPQPAPGSVHPASTPP